MTREEKIAKARELRAAGKRDPEISAVLGLSVPRVSQLLKGTAYPARSCYVCGSVFTPTHGNQKTCCGENARKRYHENRIARASCPRCGAELGPGSAYPSKTPDLCMECHRDESHARTVRFIQLRKEGLSNVEISEREGLEAGSNIVAQILSRAGRYGLDVPPPPYWSRGKAA